MDRFSTSPRQGQTLDQHINMQYKNIMSLTKIRTDLLENKADITLSPWPHHPIKRAFDMLGATALLVLFSPIMAATTAAIMLDSKGPALFKQPRIGQNEKPFVIYKFRTMKQELCDTEGKELVTRHNDPRVTRIGHFLRRTKIDELPQLFNVLKNDMSLVGPRPMVPTAFYNCYTNDNAALRQSLKPGLTFNNLLEAYNDNHLPFEAMNDPVQHERHYLKTSSLFNDITTCIKTLRYMVKPSQAQM
jgi:lipopolysaccharide/colanic/teichoic acid biosynthesis glycosyltransferase